MWVLKNQDFFKTSPYTNVKLAIVDPPYGIGYKDVEAGYYDEGVNLDLLAQLLKMWLDKDAWLLVFTSFMNYCQVYYAMEKYFRFRQKLVWFRPNMSKGTNIAKLPFYNVHEDILVFSKGSPKRPNKNDVGHNIDVLKYATPQTNYKIDKRIHPNQKPFKLIEHLVVAFSDEKDYILDPFAGSGVVGKVCKKHNRHYIGFEVNEIYYQRALQNIGKEE